MFGVALIRKYFLTIIILSKMSVSKRQSATFSRNYIPRPRVIEGFPDVINKYPYVVTLEIKFTRVQIPFLRMCTGSIISSQFVITAAHCLMPDLEFVRCGNMTLSISKSTCLSKILKQFPHPAYFEVGNTNYGKLNNDIALLHIEKLVMSRYGRLNSADYKTLIGRAVKYAGFGITSYSKQSVQDVLRHQELPLQIGEGVIYKDDDDRLDTNPQLSIASKCSNKKQHAFYGDSGGPLFVDDKIVGVTCSISYYMTKSIENHPPSFTSTPISPFLDWIRDVMTHYK